MTQNVENFCVRCECRFSKWVEYHAHVTANACHRQVKPIRTSTRSVAQIVKDWESNQKEGVIIG
jgi:hypothetical protein